MTVKHNVINLLLNGAPPPAIAEQLEVPLATVLRYNRELTAARQNNTVAELLNLDELAFGELEAALKTKTLPGVRDAMEEKLASVNRAVTLMDAFQSDLLTTASTLNQRIKTMALGVDRVDELAVLSECVSKLQNAFFNKNTTQVNIQNNLSNTGKPYGGLLDDKPSDI